MAAIARRSTPRGAPSAAPRPILPPPSFRLPLLVIPANAGIQPLLGVPLAGRFVAPRWPRCRAAPPHPRPLPRGEGAGSGLGSKVRPRSVRGRAGVLPLTPALTLGERGPDPASGARCALGAFEGARESSPSPPPLPSGRGGRIRPREQGAPSERSRARGSPPPHPCPLPRGEGGGWGVESRVRFRGPRRRRRPTGGRGGQSPHRKKTPGRVGGPSDAERSLSGMGVWGAQPPAAVTARS